MSKVVAQKNIGTKHPGTQEVERIILQLFSNGLITRQDITDLGNVFIELAKELPDRAPIIH